MMQQRSLSTNIPFVGHSKPSPINLSTSKNTNTNNLTSNKLVTSSSFTRTASKKRREFGKDKKNVSSNFGLPQTTATVHQVKLEREVSF